MSWLRKKTGIVSFLPSGEKVRVHLDADVDAATIVVSDEPVARSVRIEGLGLVDLDESGDLVAVEIFSVSTAAQRLERMERERQSEPSESMVTDLLQALAPRFVIEAKERVKTA